MRVYKLLDSKKSHAPVTINPDSNLLAAVELLSERKIGALPVVNDDNAILGIVSERDVVRNLAKHQSRLLPMLVRDIMTTAVITCHESDSAEDVFNLMTEKRIRHIPVVRDGKLVAMLSLRDFETVHSYLQAHSVTDDQTGTSNARAFAHHLESEFNRFRRFQSPLSVIAVRIGEYEQALERHGQSVRDGFLKGIASGLEAETRSFDILGHIADDVFGIILPNTGEKAAHRACQRVVGNLRSFLLDEAAASGLRIGVGLAFAGRDTRSCSEIIDSAKALAGKAIMSGGGGYEAEIHHGIEAAE